MSSILAREPDSPATARSELLGCFCARTPISADRERDIRVLEVECFRDFPIPSGKCLIFFKQSCASTTDLFFERGYWAPAVVKHVPADFYCEL